ncbi:unnamed protein product [Microthlaspi erraticum]|uniref:RNase H type-1 domain-containing protein n=1 Tax=Microthlaspi erraticum TaxID=1685480 RepID=A0A6D2KI72_9BRAS|nr:unnamed protein product [Microthlaspi erraticum]
MIGLVGFDGMESPTPPSISLIWPWLLWRIWKSRNDLCYNSKSYDAQEVVTKTLDDVKEWFDNQPQGRVPQTRNAAAPQRWKPPTGGTFKCNSDASWKLGSDKCSVGWILRDSTGNGKWFGEKVYPTLLSSLEAEAAAMVWAMRVLDNMGYGEVVFETDSQVLFQAIKDPQQWARLASYVNDIKGPWRNLKPSFSTCGREANGSADLIAKTAFPFSIYHACLECSIPSWLSPSIELEKQYVMSQY